MPQSKPIEPRNTVLPVSESQADGKFPEGPEVTETSSASHPPAKARAKPLEAVRVTSQVSRQQAQAHPRRKWLWFWQLWLLLMMGGVIGVGSTAFINLTRLPQKQDCDRIFQPLVSASLRLYCAQVSANAQTQAGLLTAIELVDALPVDHPLRSSANRYIKAWTFDLIILAEDQFNAGELGPALATLRKIPVERLPCDQEACIQTEVKSWQEEWQNIWSNAEEIYRSAENALIDQDWDEAAAIGAKLLAVDNRYWRDTRYAELKEQIQQLRDTNHNLAQAKELAEKGGASNLAQAIQLASQTESSSKLYAIAQAQIAKFSRQMLDLAKDVLEAENLSEALDIVNQIPEAAGLEDEVKDFTTLANLEAKTWSGKIVDLEAAIQEARTIEAGRPLYPKAQQEINGWRQEIADIKHLQRARELAVDGEIVDLMAAIAEVSLIPKGNPRGSEAQNLIATWTDKIQVLEDGPYLTRAEQLAGAGTIVGYQAAISELRQIGRGRALYTEAQAQIDEWQIQLERIQDQPYLDEAIALASIGNYPAAISVAQQIQPGRALYWQAQSEIDTWRLQIQAEASLRQAQGLSANPDDPDSLAAAIRAAERVPSETPQWSEASADIERWSQQLLQIAQERANYDLFGAIEVANRIPANTAAYWEAQPYLQAWREAAGL